MTILPATGTAEKQRPFSSVQISRRDLLASLGVGGAAITLAARSSAQSQISNPRRLDLHHHFASPRWKKRIAETNRQGAAQMQNYSVEKDIESMDEGGVATAFISTASPGNWQGTDFLIERDEAIANAREQNEFGARMVSDHKGRFALFATLPLPDVEASLREVEYAFDTLHAVGVGLLSSYGSYRNTNTPPSNATVWLGDKAFQPVFDELNRRNAIVYTHPTDGPCCRDVMPGITPISIEWNTDTSRTILSMIFENYQGKGTPSAANRYSNIKFIWSHAGTIVGLAGRWNTGDPKMLAHPEPGSRLYNLRRFYYDVAGGVNPVVMQGMKMLIGSSQIVFGTDYPWGTPSNIARSLQECGFTSEEIRGIDRENALKMFPNYRG